MAEGEGMKIYIPDSIYMDCAHMHMIEELVEAVPDNDRGQLLDAARKAEDMEEFYVARWLRDWI